MESKKLNKNSIQKLIDMILSDDETAFGDYIYKNLRLLVRKKNPLSNVERSRKFYRNRRTNGMCLKCGEKVETNPKTGVYYRFCEPHRQQERTKMKQKRLAKRAELEAAGVFIQKKGRPKKIQDNVDTNAKKKNKVEKKIIKKDTKTPDKKSLKKITTKKQTHSKLKNEKANPELPKKIKFTNTKGKKTTHKKNVKDTTGSKTLKISNLKTTKGSTKEKTKKSGHHKKS